MNGHPSIHHWREVAAAAASCAGALSAVLAVIAMIAWMGGLASLADLPWALTGAFAGSFVVAAFRFDRQRNPLRR